MKFSVATLAGAIFAATAAAAPFVNERAPADANPADTDLPPTAYWVIAGHKREAEEIEKRTPVDANPADTDLPPTAYWVIAGHKRDNEEVERIKREAAEHVAREIDTRLAKRDDSSTDPKELGADIIVVSVVHAVKAKKGSVNAYSDYVESADAKDILGE